MVFFDYLYYFIYKFYSSYKEKGAESTSAGIVGGFQALNILFIVMVVSLVSQQKTYINKLVGIAVFLIFQIYTYIRYIYKDTHSVDVIEGKWLSKTDSYKKKISILILLYGVISIFCFFGIALYLGSRD